MEKENKFIDIKTQIHIIKQRLENIDKILNLQEKTLEVIQENTRALFKEAIFEKRPNNIEDIMKSVFKKKKLPGILFN